MPTYYPICLEVTQRPCIVIGGGAVAARKVASLLECGARVTVVSPRLRPELEELNRQKKIGVERRSYRPGDLEGAFLAMVATNDPQVSGAVAREGKERGVLVNAADDPAHCDFILPAVVRRGDLLIAVTTGGQSPALARKVREELERIFPPEYATLLHLAHEIREELKAQGVGLPFQDWDGALSPKVLELIRNGGPGAAKTELREQLLKASPGRHSASQDGAA